MTESTTPIDYNQVLEQLVINVKAGGGDPSLSQSLREQGVPEDRIPNLLMMARKRAGVPAPAVMAPLAAAPAEPTDAEPPDPPVKVSYTGPPLSLGMAFTRAVIGGTAAAVIGGIVWGVIVATTERELGLVAWGIGLLAGFAVLMGTRGAKGTVYQLVAVIAAITGIGIGKYVAFAHIFCKMVSDGQIEGVSEATMFGANTIVAFVFTVPRLLGGYDLLWVGFAVYTAWKMLSDKVKVVKA